MKRLVSAAFVLFVISCPGVVEACGSVAQRFSAMMLEVDRERLKEFLVNDSCNEPIRYSPGRDDQYIVLVLMHAVQANVPKEIVESAFSRYYCVAKMAPSSGHRLIIDYIGGPRVQEICPEDEIRRIFVVTAGDGANLRDRPSEDASKIGAIAEGAALTNGRVVDEWIRVDTYIGSGYVHRSTVRQYIPEVYD